MNVNKIEYYYCYCLKMSDNTVNTVVGTSVTPTNEVIRLEGVSDVGIRDMDGSVTVSDGNRGSRKRPNTVLLLLILILNLTVLFMFWQ